jgi:hypothetical protein
MLVNEVFIMRKYRKRVGGKIMISLIIGSSEGGFRSRDKRKRAEKSEILMKKKWLEKEARLNENWKWLIGTRIVLP